MVERRELTPQQCDQIAATADSSGRPARALTDPARARATLYAIASPGLRRLLEDLEANDIVDRPDPPSSPERFFG